MARKKRRKAPPPPPAPQRQERFHTPFDNLRETLRQATPPATQQATPPPSQPSKPAAEPLPHQIKARQIAAQRRQRLEQHDQFVFREAMADVTPVPKDPRGRVDSLRRQPLPNGLPTAEEAGLAELRELVAGRLAFSIRFTDEYMEGVAPGVDQHLATRLHRGDFAIQGHLDLHGHTVEEAKLLVEQFLTGAYATGQRCVRLIHGRGKNSPDNRPVLKEHVQMWLSQGRLSRLVLAFATAPTTDGGAGAAYVLLRRAKPTPYKRAPKR
jgi:DNA-nicking Smr family endonuclease